MSLLPYLINSRRVLDKIRDFDLRFDEEELSFISGDRLRRIASRDTSLKVDKSKYQVNLDVHHFSPEEVIGKTADGCIVVEGKHEERRDEHGWVSRQFCRRYPLPEGCNVDAVQSRLSSDGVLTVVAPLHTPANERVVPIVQTGPVRKTQEGKEYNVTL